MKLEQAKLQFIQTWGNFGSQWGINRSMAQVHAILLVSDHSLCTEDVMASLGISRGNANMNLRELMNWNLIYKESVIGDRREFFRARKRRELEPLQHHLAELKKVEQSYESISFVATIENIERLVNRLDGLSNTLMKADEHVFFGKILNMFK